MDKRKPSDTVTRDACPVAAVTTYEIGDDAWRQPWELWERGDVEIGRLLTGAVLEVERLDGPWVLASPMSADITD